MSYASKFMIAYAVLDQEINHYEKKNIDVFLMPGICAKWAFNANNNKVYVTVTSDDGEVYFHVENHIEEDYTDVPISLKTLVTYIDSFLEIDTVE